MKNFMDEDFLLQSKIAKKLYNDFAKDMPIFDYHCHISPKEIAEDKMYSDITEIWLGGDHYKWRAMRSNGINEEYITGSKSNKEKFLKWAETMPYCIGNPLYHWTHLELKRYFGVNKALSPDTAEEIWNICNQKLQTPEFSAKNIIKKSNVRALCTTDDPLDTLEYHAEIKKDKNFDVKVLPAFRPDKVVNIHKTEDFIAWVERLAEITDCDIKNFSLLLKALKQRIDFFHEAGCRLSDHGLDNIEYFQVTDDEIDQILKKVLNGESISETEIAKYKAKMLLFLGEEYAKRKWVMQYHIGVTRNNNSKIFNKIGPDTGFDAVGEFNFAQNLPKLMDDLESRDMLPKTILYSANPKDNFVIGTIIGSFQNSSIPGKIQFGSGWWFNDQKDGMIQQMSCLGNLGLLGRFIGMLTDSRSFLSYTRHEYFRRILCNLLGEWIENGEYPYDEKYLKEIVEGISFNNINKYLNIN
ncbi:MAG TPA: glucuronate isomerase [Victivallales bacterium]|nr:glucuronate isomerase [Victivallales bacterium]